MTNVLLNFSIFLHVYLDLKLWCPFCDF